MEQQRDSTNLIIGAAIEVHRELGPGLLESLYEKALVWELEKQGLHFETQVPLNICYKGSDLGEGYRMDLVVDESVVVELKTVEQILPIHEAQILSYLKISGIKLGLLLNFNVPLLKDGVKRFIL